MSEFTKWVTKTHADDPPNVVAAATLAMRFRAVRHFLKLAATQAEQDPEYVHQLRVWTRRTVAAVELYGEFLPKRKMRRLLEQLKRIRRAAGTARDLDVMAAGCAEASAQDSSMWLQKQVRRRRDKAQNPINRIWKRVQGPGRFQHDIDSSLKHILADPESAELFDEWSRRQLKPISRKFLKSARLARTNDPAVLHRFRIRGKKLRYAMELLAPAFGSGFRNKLYPVIEELLQRLGEIHDRHVARRRFRKWEATASSHKQARRLKQFAADERRRLRQSLHDFSDWWTPDFVDQLEVAFERILQTAAQGVESA